MNTRILSAFILFLFFVSATAQEQVYELRTYKLESFRPAKVLHSYFENALLPALNRQGIETIGVFEESSENLPKKIYLLIPYNNIQAFQDSKDALSSDTKYVEDASEYIKASQEKVPFNSISTNLIRSSSGFPKLVKPIEASSLYELRIYESHNEDALRRKVKMFNDGEFEIFKDVGLPMVFFGENIAGSQMPCLTYMLALKDKTHHAEGWSKFGKHPEWQSLKKIEEYANAMNNITRIFLKPLPYSQL